jgi:hypothetical protein
MFNWIKKLHFWLGHKLIASAEADDRCEDTTGFAESIVAEGRLWPGLVKFEVDWESCIGLDGEVMIIEIGLDHLSVELSLELGSDAPIYGSSFRIMAYQDAPENWWKR